jgi:hypothetical protein
VGELAYKGGASGKEYSWVEESAGEAKLKNVSDGIDLLKADSTTITDASGIKLSAHGSRHQRGGADDPADPNISNLGDSGDVSCTIGLSGSAARTTIYTPPTNWFSIIPLAVYMEVGGTVAAGETVTISVKAVLDDGSEYEIASLSVTGATGSSTEGQPFVNLLAKVRAAAANINNRRITSIVADVATDQASTTATVKVRVIGIIT